MMYAAKSEDKSHIMRSAHYLHKDLPIRLAHRIDDFRNLPFVVACNPRLLELIKTLEQEKLFTDLLQCTLDSSSDTLPLLAEGFRETKRHIKQATLVRNFLDRALTSRLCMRILIEHHIQLHEEKPNYTGAICLSFSPKKLIEKSADLVTKLCKAQYGVSPEIRLDGHVNSTFPFIPIPLHYIVPEMLKNAFRATVEHHLHSDNELPCINVTVAVNDDELILRDRGGGMKRSVLEKIFDYHFTTTDSSADLSMMSYSDQINDKLFDKFILRETNKMSGYGFGVPTSRAFCEYFNGSLSIETMFGIGTDVYIRLGLLTSEKRVVRL
ncbi:unnamed protein product [Didymodactylos carnosus]|uniref:Protein-serine/threonine kinase n=1 Tax=Didymodactylos carnosus TaxID=1234261 RepID=A0A814VX42_9BILA|nr:unnamed protein product [Didymodactylos carnosus]CAF1194655.1 unnamed protein product [Didymodactylos carnosus]CAF3959061.1 unnamed protein product [Didymodactylos carnosus]CAF3993365.1 unnamed protein product [Didymodactylos carnosus]